MIRPIQASGRTVYIIDGDTHIGKWVEQSSRLDHDQNTLPLLVPYLGGTVIDVGAFIGDHTEFYCQHSGTVYAFEPNPLAFECLHRNMEEHNNVRCFRVALGAASGSASVVEKTVFIKGLSKGRHRCPKDQFWRAACRLQDITCPQPSPGSSVSFLDPS